MRRKRVQYIISSVRVGGRFAVLLDSFDPPTHEMGSPQPEPLPHEAKDGSTDDEKPVSNVDREASETIVSSGNGVERKGRDRSTKTIIQITTWVLLVGVILAVTGSAFGEESPSTADIDVFYGKIAALASPGLDYLAKLLAVSDAAAFALKLGAPLGSLITEALKRAIPPGDKIYDSVVKLHSVMNQSTYQLRHDINFTYNRLRLGSLEDELRNKAVYPLKYVERKLYLSSEVEHTYSPEAKEDLIRECRTGDRAPEKTLDFILSYVQECVIDQIAKFAWYFAAAMPLLHQLDSKIVDSDPVSSRDYVLTKYGYVEYTMTLTQSDAKRLTSSIARELFWKSAITEAEANAFLREQTNGAIRQPAAIASSSCLFLQVAVVKSYHREAIERVVDNIRFILIRILTAASLCADVSYSPQGMVDYFRNIVYLTSETVKHITTYIPQLLASFWPEPARSLADLTVGKGEIPGNTDAYMRLAGTIRQLFAERGATGYSYQVLVSRFYSKTDIVTSCKLPACTSSDNSSALIHLSRFSYPPPQSYTRLDECDGWYLVNDDPINKTIQENWNAGTIQEVLSAVEAKVGALSNPERFPGFFFSRHSTWRTGHCNALVGFASDVGVTLPFDYPIRYYYPGHAIPFPRDCFDYFVYFFL